MKFNKEIYIMKKPKSLAICACLIFTITALSHQAQAQTKISDEMAQSYYQNCNMKSDPNVSKDTQDIFCQCTAMHMQKFMSLEDMKQMQDPNPQRARLSMNKVILDVYAPCMEFPVRDLLFNTCKKRGAPSAACDCLANEMGKYTAASAQQMLYDILQKNPNIVDPMGPIVNSPKFKAKEQQAAQSCAQHMFQ